MKQSHSIYNIATVALVILLSVLAGSCGRKSQMLRTLEAAEQLMEERADSALAILDTIDPSRLRTDEEHALYGLLYTQALAKNRLPMPPDTLIARSVAYYEDKGDRLRYTKSNYYQGFAYFKETDYSRAILAFFKAKEVSEDDSLFFWAGMACRGIRDVYRLTVHRVDELEYAKRELDLLKKSGNNLYAHYALEDLGQSYFANRDYNSALKISNELLDTALAVKNENLYYAGCRLNALSLMELGELERAYPVYLKIMEFPDASPYDSLMYASLLIDLNKPKEGYEILQQASDKELALKNFVFSKYYRSQNAHSNALLAMDRYENSVDSVFLSNAYQAIGIPIADYHNLSRELSQARLRVSKLTNVIIIFIVALIVLFCVFLFRKHRVELKTKSLMIEVLKHDIKTLEENRDANLDTIRALLKSKFSMVDQAATAKRESPHKPELAMRGLWEMADNEIMKFSKDKEFLKQVEEEIDSSYCSIMKNLRTDLPNLKEIDYRVFLFSVIGFSIPSICLLTGEDDPNKIYERRRRMKKKMRGLPDSKGTLYLKFLPDRGGE